MIEKSIAIYKVPGYSATVTPVHKGYELVVIDGLVLEDTTFNTYFFDYLPQALQAFSDLMLEVNQTDREDEEY